MYLTEEQQDLVEKNINLVWHILHTRVHIYPPSGMDRDDLFQIGCMALMDAARTYDPSKKVAFSTWAGIYINGRIHSIIRHVNAEKRIPDKKLSYLEDHVHEDGVSFHELIPDPEDFTERIGLPPEIILRRLPMRLRRVLELYLRGKTQTQIAKELGTSQANVSRSFKRIREFLTREDVQELVAVAGI